MSTVHSQECEILDDRAQDKAGFVFTAEFQTNIPFSIILFRSDLSCSECNTASASVDGSTVHTTFVLSIALDVIVTMTTW